MKQFNWARNWKKVTPHLTDKDVVFALNIGMILLNPHYRPGDPPHLEGAIGFKRIVTGKLSWHQPLGRCHWIAPFSWALGQKIFPEFKWGFLTGDYHTVAVGLKNDEISIVMDILLFNMYSAEESIDEVKSDPNWKLCYSIPEIFCKNDTEEVHFKKIWETFSKRVT